MQQKSLASAVLNGKCPHCREGDLFTHPASKLSKFNKMNSSCPRCGIRLEPEPGFYQGAMYVGYGFTMVIIIVISLVLYLAGNPSDAVYIGTVIGIMILLVPLNYRYSRIVYLYAFGGIRYDPIWSR
jgi:uncharacterized protein (DUF983 family)